MRDVSRALQLENCFRLLCKRLFRLCFQDKTHFNCVFVYNAFRFNVSSLTVSPATQPQEAEVGSTACQCRCHAPAFVPHVITIRPQQWALHVLRLIDCSSKPSLHGVQGLCVGVGSQYRVSASGVIEVDCGDVAAPG
jgi:hypothetical protein